MPIYETSSNHASQWQTSTALGCALVSGLALTIGGRWGRLAEISNKGRFALGAAPFLAGAAKIFYLQPITNVKKLDQPAILVNPKGSGHVNQGFLWKILERGARLFARFPLYPGSVMNLSKDKISKEVLLIIESLQFRGFGQTLLLRGTRVAPEVSASQETVVLLFGGNGFNASHMSDWAEAYLGVGVHVQMVDWRGFGKSEGSPNVPGTQLDTEAMVEAAIQSYPDAKLMFHGISLGAHHAAYGALYAAEEYGPDKVSACFMEQPFGKLSGAVESLIPIPGLPALVQKLYPYDNPDVVRKLLEAAPRVPIRIFRGGLDGMMNPRGVHCGSEEPKEDHNVEPIYKVILKKRPGTERSAVITDCPNAKHCRSIWTDEKAYSMWFDTVNKLVNPSTV